MAAVPDIVGGAEELRRRLPWRPDVALVLGSGLGPLVDRVEGGVEVGFAELPGFPPAGVAGHAGRWVAGTLGGARVLVQAGRYHVYEGHPPEVVAGPVRLVAALEVGTLVLTNAAGGVDPALEPGDLVLVEDHLNLMFRNPLIGPVVAGETRFPDMTRPYDQGLLEAAEGVAAELGIPVRRGVYAGLTGPAYETAAEIRMLRTLGAHVVGMSTVPEVMVARALGLRCLAVSMVTNKGTGLAPSPLSHKEVVEVGARAGAKVASLLEGVLGTLASPQSAG
ncbi:MAG: purine nucleoside phosphorylase [Gemmatimonadota bacterium]